MQIETTKTVAEMGEKAAQQFTEPIAKSTNAVMDSFSCHHLTRAATLRRWRAPLMALPVGVHRHGFRWPSSWGLLSASCIR